METELRDAVFSYIESLCVLPVYYPNQATSLPTDNHLRVSLSALQPEQLSVSKGARYQWLLQLSVCIRGGVGELVATRYIDAIRGLIPINTIFTSANYSYRTTVEPNVLGAVSTASGYLIPVQIRLSTIEI